MWQSVNFIDLFPSVNFILYMLEDGSFHQECAEWFNGDEFLGIIKHITKNPVLLMSDSVVYNIVELLLWMRVYLADELIVCDENADALHLFQLKISIWYGEKNRLVKELFRVRKSIETNKRQL